jgi:LVIVD repeat
MALTMKLRRFILILGAVVALTAALGLPAAADHKTRPHTQNLHAKGHSPHPATFLGEVSALRNVNSDIAFWGKLAFHGNYDGFRIVDISASGNPKEISWTHCNGDQGDIVVWGDILVRAWNSPAPADDPATPVQENRFCDGRPVPVGFEGMHIFDISNPKDPALIGDVELSARPQADSPGCGTHTLTVAPDLAHNRLVIYNATSGGNTDLPPQDQECDWIDIVQVPLDNPAAASHVRREPLEGGHAAHDNGVILGDVNLLATASGHMSNVFDIGDNAIPGGSLEDPKHLFTIEEEGVCFVPSPPRPAPPLDPQRPCNGNWHSASFTWDGKVIILGWEPGGGSQPECEARDPAVKKSAFFYDAQTGKKLGQWTLPRPQTADENCTIHNYNVVPVRSGKYLLVSGNYQAGTWVTDFTDPANPRTVAWSDLPAHPRVTPPGGGQPIPELGGAWSSYWYNGFIYESEITKGLNVFLLSDNARAGAIRLDHLNPQTQEFSTG